MKSIPCDSNAYANAIELTPSHPCNVARPFGCSGSACCSDGPHGSNGSISMTIAVMSMEQGSIVTSPMEKSAD
jgi:hypothetical protein